jgi:E3 ubiquitin-protein ligase HERC2
LHDEIVQKLTLFVPTDNNQYNVGEERDKLAPNPMAITQIDLDNFYKIGVAMGLSLAHYDSVPFRFPTIFWKYLLRRPINWEDYTSLSLNQKNCLEDMAKMPPSQIDSLDQDYVAYLTGGKFFQIAGAELGKKITTENFKEYIEEIKTILMGSLSKPFEQLRQGFNSIVSETMVASQSLESIEKYMCGSEFVDVSLLKKITKYEDFHGDPMSHPSVTYFWNILEGFSQKQLSMYLRFVWGRSRLGASQSNNHKLSYVAGKNNMIPESHTCFFTLDLFDYDSEEELRKKLLYGIENCTFIVEENNRINLTDL